MAISAIDVKDTMENLVDVEKIRTIEESIDAQLVNPTFLKDWRCGTPDEGYFYRFGGEGELNKGTKKELERRYMNTGWKEVKIINSSENGERAGMHMVILTLLPEVK